MNTCPRRFLGMEMKGLCSTCDIIIDDVGYDWQCSHADDYDDSDDYDDGDDDKMYGKVYLNIDISTCPCAYLKITFKQIIQI